MTRSNRSEECNCTKCRFFEDYGDGLGLCHRHAPVPRVTDIEPGSWPSVSRGPWVQWPTVTECDWCGEFETMEAQR